MHRKRKMILCKLIYIYILLYMLCIPVTAEAKNYSYYSNQSVNWGLTLNKKHKKPQGTYPSGVFSLKKYNALYLGDTKHKTIYLTFDCGYENGNTKEILDVLKKKQVHAIFFVTKPYIENNPKLVKRMKKEGHLVGNHTCTHIRLSTCSAKKIQSELKGVEKTMKKMTGYSIDKFVRPPEGNYSPKALKVMQDMGYTTVLWSLAWYDYDTKHQPSTQSVVQKFVQYHHKGMVPLLHVVSSADCEALPDIIDYMKKKKYRFGTLDDIYGKKDNISSGRKNREKEDGRICS